MRAFGRTREQVVGTYTERQLEGLVNGLDLAASFARDPTPILQVSLLASRNDARARRCMLRQLGSCRRQTALYPFRSSWRRCHHLQEARNGRRWTLRKRKRRRPPHTPPFPLPFFASADQPLADAPKAQCRNILLNWTQHTGAPFLWLHSVTSPLLWCFGFASRRFIHNSTDTNTRRGNQSPSQTSRQDDGLCRRHQSCSIVSDAGTTICSAYGE